MKRFREALEAYLLGKNETISGTADLQKSLEDFRKSIGVETAAGKTGLKMDDDVNRAPNDRWRQVKSQGVTISKRTGPSGFDGLINYVLSPPWQDKTWKQDLCEGLAAYLGKQNTTITAVNNSSQLKEKVIEFLGCILNPTAGGCTGLNKKSEDWVALKKSIDEEIQSRGLPIVVSDLRDQIYYEDYCFSTKRIPGPWLSKVVFPSDGIAPAKKLTFVLETCADHLNRRAMLAISGLSAKPAVDIHLVPSAGAQLGASNICITGTGYAFNCDGWNAPMFAAGPRKRDARVFRKVVNPEYPWNSGNNPLFPHSELWKMDAGQETTIAGGRS